jgi:thiaminase/transcriptional activator TenA
MPAALFAGDALYTDQLWAAAESIYQKTLRHPFLAGLTDGTLPRERFTYYLQQDALYLTAFSQALNVLASKAPKEDWMLTLNRHASEAIETERQLHQSLLKGAGAADRMAPTNYAYTNHLLAAVHRRSFLEGLAAMLPCYWIYWEVGRELKKRGSKNADYARWIAQYSDPSYGATVQQVLTMANSEALQASSATKQQARELFVLSARYEYLFWDMAWRLEKWEPA